MRSRLWEAIATESEKRGRVEQGASRQEMLRETLGKLRVSSNESASQHWMMRAAGEAGAVLGVEMEIVNDAYQQGCLLADWVAEAAIDGLLEPFWTVFALAEAQRRKRSSQDRPPRGLVQKVHTFGSSRQILLSSESLRC